MSELSSTPGIDSWRALKRLAGRAVRSGFVVAVAATWVAFWGLVVRLQFLQGEFLSAAVTGLAFVLPAIVGLVAFIDPLPDPRRLVPS